MAVTERIVESAVCTVAIGPTNLPAFLRSTLAASIAHDVLRQEGECSPFPTRITVETLANGALRVHATGPHSQTVCAMLPARLAEVVASTMFDADGFVDTAFSPDRTRH